MNNGKRLIRGMGSPTDRFVARPTNRLNYVGKWDARK